MRDDESNWFAKWDEDLPSPDELISLSQTLITPDLAMAFDIRNPTSPRRRHHQVRLQQPLPRLPPQDTPSSQPNSSGEFESSGGGGGGGGGGGYGSGEAGEEEPARTLKRPRLVWTPQLHKRFVEAVAHLGIKNAVPKTIMQIMSVDGLTRENVASHLQKYRLYLKRMQQGISNGSGASNSIGSGAAFGPGTDTDRLFASSPVPAHFLHPGRPNSNQFLPFVPVTAMPQHRQMAPAIGNQQIQHHIRHFGTSPPDGQFDHPFLSRQSQSHVQIMGAPVHNNSPVMGSYHKDMGSVRETGDGRRALTLFPNGDD